MTNLTLHHDDVLHLFIQDTILGDYLGRYTFGWLHFFTQNHYIMPFVQMTEGIVLMSVYGLIVARFWGASNTTDLALIAAILCVFPYMAHIYQYNTSMAPFPLAHLLAASAVVLSTRATFRSVAVAASLYVAAFSIYQSVAANAATIFVIWLLARILFSRGDQGLATSKTIRATIAAAISVVLGGLLYLAFVHVMQRVLQLEFDTDHAAEEAFRLGGALKLSRSIPEIWQGTRSFFIWPESYFPDYLKAVQLVFLVVAGIFCLLVPARLRTKIAAAALLVLAIFTPRVLQLLHPDGTYHSLTLTAYAIVIAGAVMIVSRAGRTVTRNLSIVVSTFLIAGYVLQCNWISTVNYLNTIAHFTTMTQVLAQVRSVPDAHWDGKKIAVVGTYDPPSDYPFKLAAGVATKFIDAKHMEYLARLMRDEATFVAADETMPKVLEYAATHPSWPEPGSVGVVDGMGVVVFSKRQAAPQ